MLKVKSKALQQSILMFLHQTIATVFAPEKKNAQLISGPMLQITAYSL